MNRHQVVRAVFRPTRTDTLKPGVVEHIGKTLAFMADFPIERGPYANQREMWVAERRDSGGWTRASAPFCGWVPEEDLEVLETLDWGVDREWNRLDGPEVAG